MSENKKAPEPTTVSKQDNLSALKARVSQLEGERDTLRGLVTQLEGQVKDRDSRLESLNRSAIAGDRPTVTGLEQGEAQLRGSYTVVLRGGGTASAKAGDVVLVTGSARQVELQRSCDKCRVWFVSEDTFAELDEINALIK